MLLVITSSYSSIAHTPNRPIKDLVFYNKGRDFFYKGARVHYEAHLYYLELFSELNFGPAGKQFELEAVCSSQVCFPDDVVFIRIVVVEKGLAEVVVLKGFFDQKLQCGFHIYLNEFLGWFCLSSFNFLSFLVALQIANLQWPNFTGDADSSEIQNMFKVRSVEFLRLQDVLGSLQLQIASIVVAVGGFTVSWFRPRSQCDFRCRIVPSPSISHS